eukprot:907548-Rhodomonas_salina.1
MTFFSRLLPRPWDHMRLYTACACNASSPLRLNADAAVATALALPDPGAMAVHVTRLQGACGGRRDKTGRGNGLG